MRNLFYFLPVLTTRACVNKYGVPQIGKVTIPDPDIRYSIADKQFKMSLTNHVAALLQQRDQRSAASPPLKSVMLPTNRSMSPSSAYVTSYIADKSLRAATSRWGQETMFYIAGKQIGISCGSGRRNCFHWETAASQQGQLRGLSLNADKQIKTDGPLRRFNLIKCRYPFWMYFRSCFADKEIYEYT